MNRMPSLKSHKRAVEHLYCFTCTAWHSAVQVKPIAGLGYSQVPLHEKFCLHSEQHERECLQTAFTTYALRNMHLLFAIHSLRLHLLDQCCA